MIMMKKGGRRNTAVEIVNECRRRFSENEWPAGTSLPSNRKLAVEFGVSLLTMQKALDRLRQEGLVKIENRRGTIVAPNASPYVNYGIAFSLNPTSENEWSWSSFNTGMLHQMSTMNAESNWKGRAYFGVDGPDTKDYRRLEQDLNNDVLSGLILIGYECVKDTPVVKNRKVPLVGIKGNRPLVPGISYISMGHYEMIDKALSEIAAHGRKRVAVLAQSSNGPNYESDITARIRAYGMTTYPHWIQGSNVQNPHWSRNCMQLLLHPGQAERPDAVLVTDDNLLACACLGITASGMCVPDDIMIASAWNFPESIPPGLPILKVGFDLRTVINTCIRLIQRQMSHEEVPEVTEIPVLISNDLTYTRLPEMQLG